MTNPLTPDCEVKLLLKPSAVLNSDNKPKDSVLSTFKMESNPIKMNVQFLETNEKAMYAKNWILRIRKMEGEDGCELTYKKRCPIDGSNINLVLATAQGEGFDTSTAYEAQVEMGYQTQGLSLSLGKEGVKTDVGGMDLPGEAESREMLTANAPKEFTNTSAPGWGTQMIAQSSILGPVMAKRYKGKWKEIQVNDKPLKVVVEVWPFKDEAGTGIEYVTEASFKMDDVAEAAKAREKLAGFLKEKGWLLGQDFSRTEMIMRRYGPKSKK